MPKFYWDILYLKNKPKYSSIINLQDAVLFYLNQLIFWDKSKISYKSFGWLQDMVLHYMKLLSSMCKGALPYMNRKPITPPNRVTKRYKLVRRKYKR